jgi:hypothetical protein
MVNTQHTMDAPTQSVGMQKDHGTGLPFHPFLVSPFVNCLLTPIQTIRQMILRLRQHGQQIEANTTLSTRSNNRSVMNNILT